MTTPPIDYTEAEEYELDERDTLKHELQRARDEKAKEIMNKYNQNPELLYINPIVITGFVTLTTMYSKKYSKKIILCGDRHVHQLKCKQNYRYLPIFTSIEFIENLLLKHENTKMFIEIVSEEVAMFGENSGENFIRGFNAYFERFKHIYPSKLSVVESDIRKVVNKILEAYDMYTLWYYHHREEKILSNEDYTKFHKKYHKLQKLQRELDTPLTWEMFYNMYSTYSLRSRKSPTAIPSAELPPTPLISEEKEPPPASPSADPQPFSALSAFILRSFGVDFFIHDELIFKILDEIGLLNKFSEIDQDLNIASWFFACIEIVRNKFLQDQNVVNYILYTSGLFVDLFVLVNMFLSPEENIILYFGNNHIENIKEFLQTNGFDTIEEYQSLEKGVDHQCIRVQNFVNVFDMS